MNNIVLADELAGVEIFNWLFKRYPKDIGLVVVFRETVIIIFYIPMRCQ
jgi:hypothetical protein